VFKIVAKLHAFITSGGKCPDTVSATVDESDVATGASNKLSSENRVYILDLKP